MNRWVSITLAGVVSGSAFLGAQAVDLTVTRNRLDDRVLLGRLAPVPADRARPVGTVLHLAISVVLAAIFRLLVRDRLPGPMWVRGTTFATAETIALYPITLLEDFHPATRDGQLDSYHSRTAFLQQLWRHGVFGLVLGLLTPKRG